MSELSCQVDLHNRPTDKPLTVGDAFTLQCDGDIGTPLKDNAQFVFEIEESTYTMHVLAVQESTEKNIKLLVTSYKPGDYTSQSLKISDGTNTVITQGVSWRVSSVLDPKAGEPKPVPSMGPFLISYPLWFWLTIGAIVIALGGLFGWVFYRRTKARRLAAEIESFMTMLTPFGQFSRDMRTLARQIDKLKSETAKAPLLQKLDEDFRSYLVRELKVPAHKYSSSQILRAIKKSNRRVYDEGGVDLRRVLSEFKKANQESEKIAARDCEDLFHLSRQVAEKIYNIKRKAT